MRNINYYTALTVLAGLTALPLQQALSAQVITTDLIVQGSECVGVDCSSSESFGFDTLRLKENNLRIHFDDTSSSASFPKNDWRISINGSNNGDASYFAVEDATAGRVPFRIEAGAISNALYVDSEGDVGVGTASPVVEVHTVDGNTPTLRMEQDGSSGFTPQTWDVAGNETNFFIRDVTNQSKLPFRIKPGAPDNSIFIAADGDVGMGTADNGPNATLHIVDSAASLLLEESDSNTAPDTALHIKRSTVANTRIALESTQSGGEQRWNVGLDPTVPSGTFFTIVNSTGGGMSMDNAGSFLVADSTNTPTFSVFSGNGTFTGSVTATAFNTSSTRTLKDNFTEVDVHNILDVVAELPITRWNFKSEGDEVAHLGPMAEDFYQAFGLGTDDKHIATVDSDGVALAAIQALHQKQQAKEQQIRDLTRKLEQKDQQMDALAEQLRRLESKLSQIAVQVQ